MVRSAFRSWTKFLAALLLLTGSGLLPPAVAAEFVVGTREELATVLKKAEGGDVIKLKPGKYAPIKIGDRNDFDQPVTITSAELPHSAVVTELTLEGATNIEFRNILFDYEFEKADKSHDRFVSVANAKHISFVDCVFDGDEVEATGKDIDDGYATGVALGVRNSSDIIVKGNMFRRFLRGGVFRTVTNLEVSKNEVTEMRSDGFNFVEVENARITGNYMHDFKRSLESADHADMIQFWTSGTKKPSTDILIEGNFIDAGTHRETQSVFFGNEEVRHGRAGTELYYRNLTIRENVIRNSQTNGITIGYGIGVVIENNTIIQQQALEEGRKTQIPLIMITKGSRDVIVRNNIVPRTLNLDEKADASWTMKNNYVVQRNNLSKTDHYNTTFVDALARKSTTLDDLKILPTSSIAGRGLGASASAFNTSPETLKGFIHVRSSGKGGFEKEFDATYLYGPGGKLPEADIVSVEWDLGDGQKAAGGTVKHQFSKPGIYALTARIETRNTGAITLAKTVEIGNTAAIE